MFILNERKIEKGDIILLSGNSKLLSKAIKIATNSSFSHAMVYTGGSIIDATDEGVFSTNPHRLVIESKKHVKVFRLNGGLSLEEKEKLCRFLRLKVGSLYSKSEAIRTKIFSNTKKEGITEHQFCSRLVAQAYKSINYLIVNNVDYCSPEDINKSNQIHEVKDSLKEMTSHDMDFAESHDIILDHQRQTYDWLEKARTLAKSDNFEIYTINDVETYLIKHPESDKIICNYLDDSGYLDFYKIDLTKNPYRHNIVAFRMYCSKHKINHNHLISEEIKVFRVEINRHLRNLINSKKLSHVTALNFYKKNMELYKNILMQFKNQMILIHNIARVAGNNRIHEESLSLINKIHVNL